MSTKKQTVLAMLERIGTRQPTYCGGSIAFYIGTRGSVAFVGERGGIRVVEVRVDGSRRNLSGASARHWIASEDAMGLVAR